MKNLFIITCFLLALPATISAQSCDQKLSDAEKAFEAGQLYRLDDILLPCFKNNSFNREEKVRGYRLMIISYLYLDEPEQAEMYYLKLLKLKPEYRPQVSDPSELQELSRKFTSEPRVSLLPLQFGTTYAMPDVENAYTIDSEEASQQFDNSYGVSGGVGAEYTLLPWLLAGTGLHYSSEKFTYRKTILGYSQLSFTENQQYLTVPVYMKAIYGDMYSNFRPYVFGGISYGIMINAEARNLLRRDVSQQEVDITGPDISLAAQRSDKNIRLMAGTGFAFKMGVNFISFDIAYQKGINNMLDESGQYANNTLLFRYGFTDNDYFLNSFNASVRLLIPLYAPRKLNERRAR